MLPLSWYSIVLGWHLWSFRHFQQPLYLSAAIRLDLTNVIRVEVIVVTSCLRLLRGRILHSFFSFLSVICQGLQTPRSRQSTRWKEPCVSRSFKRKATNQPGTSALGYYVLSYWNVVVYLFNSFKTNHIWVWYGPNL